MFYKKIHPHSALQTLVECYYIWESHEHVTHPIMVESPPTGFTSIVFNYGDFYKTASLSDTSVFSVVPGSFIAGQATRGYKFLIEGRIGMIGIVFRPSAVNMLFGIQMYELNDERLDLKDVLGKEIRSIHERILEAGNHQERVSVLNEYLLFQLLNCKTLPTQADYAANLILRDKGIVNISKMMDDLCVSRRQLERQFLQKVGVSPKYYARIRRISYLCSLMANQRWKITNWHDLIYQMGYYDQSHFIKEFTSFTGRSPSFYSKNNLELRNYLQQ